MFEIIRPGTNFDFVGKRHFFMGLSLVAVVLSIVLIFTRGLNYGVDFVGGAEVQIQVPKTWEIAKVRDALDNGGFKGLGVVQIGEPANHQFLVRAQGNEGEVNQISEQIQKTLAQELKTGEFEVQRVDVVGPAAGKSLRTSAFLSLLYAIIGIMVYVALRFDTRYAPGAVLSLAHDAIVTVGVFSLLQKQFDLQIVAAVLALIGYSINDTIVIYDRIRETMQQYPNLKIEEAINKSVNDMLGRTILTSGATLFAVCALWIFGGPVIHDFSFALLIGMIAGCYSTVFVASPIIIWMTRYYEKRDAKAGLAKKSSGKNPSRPELA